MLKAILVGGACVAAGAVWALTAVAAESPEAATKARQNMTNQASLVAGSVGQFGGNALYAGSFVVQGGVRGVQNTGLGNMLTTTTLPGASGVVPPPSNGAVAP